MSNSEWESKLSAEDRQFIIEKAASGFTAEEIVFMMRDDLDRAMTPSPSTVESFLESEDGTSHLELRKSVRSKKADIEKEDLVETLVNLKTELQMWQEQLRDENHGVTANEAIKNLLKTIEKIGELKGELQRSGTSKNIVKIDKSKQFIQNNIVKVVKHLPKEDKRDIAEQLADDPDVENFVIQRAEE